MNDKTALYVAILLASMCLMFVFIFGLFSMSGVTYHAVRSIDIGLPQR